MKKQLFWSNPTYQPSKSLMGHHETSYLIVGGGVAGLFAAHYLLKKGVKNITLIEKNIVGSGSTGYSAGMLESEIEIPREMLTRRHGVRSTALYIRAQRAAQREVRQLVKKEKIPCDYEERPLFFFKDDSASGTFVEKSISVNPVKFAQGIAVYLRQKGVRIYENTPLVIAHKNIARTTRGSIAFDQIIYALGTSQKHPAISNYVTTICVTRRLSTKTLRYLRRTRRDMFFYDERQSYHYGKITRDGRLLVGYGDILRTSSKTDAPLHAPHVRSIKRFIKRITGSNLPIHRAWSAAYALSKRSLPYVSINKGVVGGAGTQIASIAAASYFVNTLLREKHPLKSLFKADKTKV